MKSESGSALQKATFIVLLLVLGCLAFLVMREFSRSERRATEAREAAATAAAQANQPAATDTPVMSVTNPAFAPLRPRVETNVVRVVTNRVPVVLRTNFPVLTGAETMPVPVERAAFAQDSPVVPVVYTPGVTPGTPATVFGRATLRGVPPAETPIPLDAACGRLNPTPITTRHYLVGADGGLANVFVYIKTGAPKAGRQASVPVLDNVNCEFQPYVMGIRAGQPFNLRNSDPVLHSAHIMPKPGGGNREANIGMPLNNMSVTRVFDKPEVFVKVKCDVHPWMFAYIGVVDHPWFEVTDQNGNFTLPLGLPVGQYTLAAIHLKAGELTQPINVSTGNVQPVSFSFEVPKPLARTP